MLLDICAASMLDVTGNGWELREVIVSHRKPVNTWPEVTGSRWYPSDAAGSDETLLHAGGEGLYVDGGERMLLDSTGVHWYRPFSHQSPMKSIDMCWTSLDFPTPRVLQSPSTFALPTPLVSTPRSRSSQAQSSEFRQDCVPTTGIQKTLDNNHKQDVTTCLRLRLFSATLVYHPFAGCKYLQEVYPSLFAVHVKRTSKTQVDLTIPMIMNVA